MKLPKKLNNKKISKEYFIKICNESKSMAGAASKLEMPFSTFKRNAILLKCYKTNEAGKGLIKSKIKTEDILVKNSSFSRCQLKARLIRDNILEYKCAVCNNTGEWLGKQLSLELDHINGIHNDNRLINLRILCPNCHSQTPTFRKKK